MPDPNDKVYRSRLFICTSVFILFLSILLVRLWFVQVVEGYKHTQRIQNQSIRRIRMTSVRGQMYARDGKRLMVDNQPSYNVLFHLSEMRQPGVRQHTEAFIMQQARRLCRATGRDLALTLEDIQRHMNYRPALPLEVLHNLNETELAGTADLVPAIPGMVVEPDYKRFYPYPSLAPHVFGFTARTSELRGKEEYSFVTPALQGRSGLESQYNDALSGEPGMRLVRVDTFGYVYEQIGQSKTPHHGNNLVLNLDLDAQIAAERALGEHKGAVVMVEVQSGGVMAMVSKPAYRLDKLSAKMYSELSTDDERKPLMNRAVRGGFQPGSILKPLVGLAALETGVVKPREKHECTGVYMLGRHPIRCWNRHGHGFINIVNAIKVSCNPFFIEYGLKVGLDRLRPFFLDAGLGRAPEIDLPYSGSGFIPSREWASQKRGTPWSAVDTAYISIGQGPISVSPLQVALYTAAIANGGTIFRPFLVRQIRSPDGMSLKYTSIEAVHQLPVSRENLALIRSGMRDAVYREDGTAENARNTHITVAGKTGTAELGSGNKKLTWFTGFAPVDNPEYALTIMIEDGVSGGRTAAPVASRLFDNWFRLRQ